VARYSIRDLLGHFVKPKARQGDLCPHACCRNRRVHPDRLPVMLKPDMVRRLPEADLIEHYGRVADNPRAAAQALRAIDKRDQAAKVKEARARGAGERKAAARMARDSEVEQAFLAAEAATNGNMVNRKGVRAGVSAQSLMTGSEARAMRYAHDDLLAYWERHPRPSAGLRSSNPRVVRRARARSDIGRQERRRPAVYDGIY